MQKFDDDELRQEESTSKREALWKRLEEMGGIPNGKSSQ
jgi:serine/threonine-protein phosphatase 2A regulatory subunit B'